MAHGMGRDVRQGLLRFVVLIVLPDKPLEHALVTGRRFGKAALVEEQEIGVAPDIDRGGLASVLHSPLQRLVDLLAHGDLPRTLFGLGLVHIVAELAVTQELVVHMDAAVFKIQVRCQSAQLGNAEAGPQQNDDLITILPVDRIYHFIRRTSDRICKEHGLSVIVPGRDKGKSYIEHQAEQNGTSYKAKLRAAIDRLLPGCADLEDLLRRLQREGYELKRGKYISARAPGQERFTRLKTLGADYAEEALAARIAGRPSPSRQPKPHTGKPSLLIDIQNNIKAQQSAGYKHWATIENLKRAAETLNFLTEHGIGSLEDLSERCDGAAAATARVKADLRATEKEMERLTLTMKHAATYRQLRPLYEEYRQSRDKEKFLRGHEGEIILFEAAARELKRLDAVPLPATRRLRAEMDELTARRTALQSEYRKAQREEKEYDTLRQNVEALLEKPREAEPQRLRSNELE